MKCPLHELALECVKNYKRSEKDLIDVLIKMDASKEYLRLGVSSLFRYCVEKLSLSEAETHRFIQVSRKAEKVPALRRAIDDGVLTVSKASRVAPVINTTNQEMWIQKAQTLTHREIEREVVSAAPKTLRKERLEARTEDTTELRLNISRALETKLLRAQEVLRTSSLSETIEKMADLALKQKDTLEKAKRVLGAGIQKQRTAHQGQSHDTGPNSLSAKRPMQYVENKKPFTSSWPLRTPIPASLRHRVNLRDQGKCAFKNCGEKRWVDLHHIQPLAMGGKHSVENLMLLCSAHHAWMHGPKRRVPIPGRHAL